MTQINHGRIVVGGIVAAIVLFIVSGIVNGAILGSAWQEWLRAMGSLNHAPAGPVGAVIWAVVSLVFGVTGIWIYPVSAPVLVAGPRRQCGRLSCSGCRDGSLPRWGKWPWELFLTT
jgi:hypothetical protein